MDQQSPAEVVGAYFHALAENRVGDAMTALAPHVQWHQPGDNRFSGIHHGREAVGTLLASMMEVSEGTFAVAPTGPLMSNQNLVTVPVRFTGDRDGQTLDQEGVDLIMVRDGQITEVWLFSSDGPAEDRFWGTA